MKKLDIKQINKKMSQLKGSRGTFESHWQEVADFFIPNRATITTKKSAGQKDAFQLLDNIGVQSNELLAGAMHGLLTNTDSQWFEFTTGDLATDNDDDARLFMQQSTRIIHNVLGNTNFHTELHEVYLEMPSLGTSCMFVDEDDRDIVRFSTKPIEDYLLGEDKMGVVNQVYYTQMLTAGEIIEEYGDKDLPEKVIKCKDSDEKFKVVHAVYAETLADAKSTSKKFISHHFMPDENHELRTGKYHENPFITPRFSKRVGEIYGRSPAMTALPEMRVLNKMNQTLLVGMQKQVDPPLQVEDDGVILPLVTRPGGINYRRPGAEPIQPLFTGTRIDIAYQALTERRQRVRDAFYVDQLRLSQDMKYMTATEVMQRTEDTMRLLGPLVGRMNAEFLRPLINRVFRICMDRGILPAPPAILQGKKLDVRYSSLIAKSQRVAEIQNVQRTVETLAPFFQLDPNIRDNFKGDAIVRIISGVLGFPQEGLASAREVKAIRDGRMQQQQQQMAMAQGQMETQQTLDAVGVLAKAQKEVQGGQ